MPELPTPPNGRFPLTKCIMQSLTETPPELVEFKILFWKISLEPNTYRASGFGFELIYSITLLMSSYVIRGKIGPFMAMPLSVILLTPPST